MAFDVGCISQWNNEIADRSKLILKPILGARSMDFMEKYSGITGENVKLPIFETTAPFQAGASCGFTTSGTTTLTQFTMTTSPIIVQEQICLQDLETKFAKAWLPPGTSQWDTFTLVDEWVNRKLAQVSKSIEQLIWQGNTAYTNSTVLKQVNGLIKKIDDASDEIVVTATADITTSNVRTIFEEAIFNATTGLANIPDIFQEEILILCGMDTFMILQNKMLTDNLYHFPPMGADVDKWELTYPGTNFKVRAVPGLNANNPVDTGSLPAAVKDRIVATYKGNLAVGFNAENDVKDFEVWYSQDDRVLRMSARFHIGVGVKFTDKVVTYANS